MKRKEKAAVDEFVALVGGKTWEPVRHKCMGKWSGMTDYGFVIDGRITLFVSNSMAYFKKRIREWIKSIHTFEAKKDCYLRLLREQIEKDNDKAKDEKLNPVRLIDIGILSPESNSPFDFFTPYVLVEINGRRFKHQTAELSCAIMVDSLAGYLEECNCKDIYTARAGRRGERHRDDRSAQFVDFDAVNQTKVDDVDAEFRVDDLVQGFFQDRKSVV